MSTTLWLLVVLAAFLAGIALGAWLAVTFRKDMEASS